MKRYIGVLLAFIIFLFQLWLIPGTGMTWDEPASFFIGRANLKFWLTGERKYIDNIKNKQLFKSDPFQYIYGEDLYPPFPFFVESATSYIVAEKFHWMSPIDAHHLGEVVMGSIGIAAFYYLAVEIGLSIPVSVVTTMMFSLYPTIFGQMRSDAKDIPLMSMLVVFVYFFIRFVKSFSQKNKTKTVLLGTVVAIFFGVAQASKPTAIIIVPILALWLFLGREFRLLRSLRKILLLSPYLALISSGVFFLFWPWLWADPVGRLTQVWQFFKVVGYFMPVLYFGTEYRAGINVPWHYPFGILGVQTPILILILGLIGHIGFIRLVKKGNVYALLPLVWFWLVMGRFLVPGMIIYARVRHFIDAMPALFLLMGIGFDWVYKMLNVECRMPNGKTVSLGLLVTGFISVIIIFHELYIIKTFYPYEPSYFNVLVGGTKTVAEQKLFDAEYWASGVKEAMDFIKAQKKPNTVVYTCFLRHLAYFYQSSNVTVTTKTWPANYVILPNSSSYFSSPLDFYRANHQLVHIIQRDGADLFYIFAYTMPVGWHCGWETETTF